MVRKIDTSKENLLVEAHCDGIFNTVITEYYQPEAEDYRSDRILCVDEYVLTDDRSAINTSKRRRFWIPDSYLQIAMSLADVLGLNETAVIRVGNTEFRAYWIEGIVGKDPRITNSKAITDTIAVDIEAMDPAKNNSSTKITLYAISEYYSALKNYFGIEDIKPYDITNAVKRAIKEGKNEEEYLQLAYDGFDFEEVFSGNDAYQIYESAKRAVYSHPRQ